RGAMSKPQTGGPPLSPVSPDGPSTRDPALAGPALEYARGIHAEAHDFNKELYRRAQIVITLDGVIIAAAGAVLSAQPDDLRRTVSVFGSTTWAALALAGAALIASVLSSAMALYSRHMQGAKRNAGAAYMPANAYVPANMWFYRGVAELDPGRFIEVAEQ